MKPARITTVAEHELSDGRVCIKDVHTRGAGYALTRTYSDGDCPPDVHFGLSLDDAYSLMADIMQGDEELLPA